MYKSFGILKYGENRLTLEVENDLVNYYRKLIPLWLRKPNKQLYSPHISVIRHETPDKTYWRNYEGEVVEFFYDGIIYQSETYCWLDCFSTRLEEIRKELKLNIQPKYPIDRFRKIDGFNWTFHLTLGNYKNINS